MVLAPIFNFEYHQEISVYNPVNTHDLHHPKGVSVQLQTSEAWWIPSWIWAIIRYICSECCWSTLGKRGDKGEFSIGTEGIGPLTAGGLCQWHDEVYALSLGHSAPQHLLGDFSPLQQGFWSSQSDSLQGLLSLWSQDGHSPECGNDIVLCF